MKLKPTLLAASLALAAGALTLAPAASADVTGTGGTVTISGTVVGTTCIASVNGGSTVDLGQVASSKLVSSAGTAYLTSAKGFTIALTGCPANTVGLIFQSGGQADTSAGAGPGTLTSGVSNLDVQLMSTKSGSTLPTMTTSGGTAVSFDGTKVINAIPTSSGDAYFNFYAQYYPLAAYVATDTGSVSTSAIFLIDYQ